MYINLTKNIDLKSIYITTYVYSHVLMVWGGGVVLLEHATESAL